MSKYYYHATSLAAALSILKQGFKCSTHGLNGAGVYLAHNPLSALYKSHTIDPGAIIVVTVNIGRLTIEKCPHNDWNLQKIKMKGFDCVQTNCKSGSEICVYEPWRITIVETYYLKSKIGICLTYVHESNPFKTIVCDQYINPSGPLLFNVTVTIKNLCEEKKLYGGFNIDSNNISKDFTLFSKSED